MGEYIHQELFDNLIHSMPAQCKIILELSDRSIVLSNHEKHH